MQRTTWFYPWTLLCNTTSGHIRLLDGNPRQWGNIDAIYIDLRKAFEYISHRPSIHKTKAHGIRGPIIRWIKDFLKDRTQHVFVNGNQSQKGQITSGIPQGSVLRPILFVNYIKSAKSSGKRSPYVCR